MRTRSCNIGLGELQHPRASFLRKGFAQRADSWSGAGDDESVVDIRVNGTSLYAGRFGEKFTTTAIVHGATIVSLNQNDEVTIVLDNGTVRLLAVYPGLPHFQSCNFCIFEIN